MIQMMEVGLNNLGDSDSLFLWICEAGGLLSEQGLGSACCGVVSPVLFFFSCLPKFVVEFVGWVGKYPRELTDGSCFSWDSNMHVEGFLSTLSLGELWYVVYLGINCIDFAEGYEEERGLCHDSVMDVSLGPPGLHSQSYCNGFQWPWASQQKPGFTLKSECVKMAFPTQQIWALCALQVTSADFSDKNKFLWLSCSVSTSETWEQESWIPCRRKQKLDLVPPCRIDYCKPQPAVGLHWHHLALPSFPVNASRGIHGRKEPKLILLIEF